MLIFNSHLIEGQSAHCSAAEVIAAAVTTLVYVTTRSLLPAMAAGVLAVYLARLWLAA